MILILKKNPVHLMSHLLYQSLYYSHHYISVIPKQTTFIISFRSMTGVFLMVALAPKEPTEGLKGDCNRLFIGVLLSQSCVWRTTIQAPPLGACRSLLQTLDLCLPVVLFKP